MVFSDPLFLAGFLPASLVIFYVIRTYVGGTAAVWTLLGLSMVFYAYWSVLFLGLLLFQIAVNYAAGYHIETAPYRALAYSSRLKTIASGNGAIGLQQPLWRSTTCFGHIRHTSTILARAQPP
jgi:hypothetical protein